MNTLDSRFLRPGDAFAQRFTQAGTYYYAVGIQGSLAAAGHDAPFVIVVADAVGAEPKTHYVTVAYAAGAFSATPPKLEINRNDGVMWHGTTPGGPGFAVSGESGDTRFDSAEIHANGMYSHAFGVSGVVDWSDAHEPEPHGTVIVETHPSCHTHEDRQAYMQKLAKATLVMIEDGRARPSKVKITVGQTVFFAIKSSAGVSIVDRRLLLNPQPLPP